LKRKHIQVSVDTISPVHTAHQAGSKKVLAGEFQFPVIIKQVAVGRLLAGDRIEAHTHPDMDEYYFFLKGNGTMRVDESTYELKAGTFIIVTAGSEHELSCDDSPLEFYYQSFEVAAS
jgi:quercetin dioxygenase-like cupin family protein